MIVDWGECRTIQYGCFQIIIHLGARGYMLGTHPPKEDKNHRNSRQHKHEWGDDGW